MAGGTFTYTGNTANPYGPIDFVRAQIPDTVEFGPDGTTPIYLFSNEEILMFEQIVMQSFQSSMFWSPPGGPPGGGTLGANLPSQPIPYNRVLGQMLMTLANNQARLAGVTKLLDVTLDWSKAAAALTQRAQSYFDLSDNDGSFMIIEQVSTDWAYQQRYWNQWARQTAGV